MKRLILISFCCSLIPSLVACGNSGADDVASDNGMNTEATQSIATTLNTQSQSDDSSIDTLKINAVRGMYDNLPSNSDIDDMETILKTYGSVDIQNALALAKEKASTSEQMYNEGISMCDEAGWGLKLLPTQDLDMEEVLDVDYRVLNNSNVRASIITDVYSKDIDSPDFEIYKDYSFDCGNEDCKVDDILSYDGISAKSEIRKYCR